jgi:hypothetical protein
MNKLTITDVKPLSEYEGIRKEFRNRVIALKRNRRVPLGDFITLVFENRDTLLFQVQEMMRTEHIYDPTRIQEELDTYNALIPGSGELSATLFIEITEPGKIKEILDRLQGIDRLGDVFLELGPDRINAVFETGHSKDDKLSAVHYVRFPLNPDQQTAFRDEKIHAALVVDHPHYQARTTLTPAIRASLAGDFTPAA